MGLRVSRAAPGKGERRVVSVLFADVAGFTRMSERYDPEVLTRMLNELFRQQSEVVGRYDGTVDKFIGDAAMVLFGAPVAHEDDAARAVACARELLAILPRVNATCAERFGWDPHFALHMGIATGLVVAGWIGTETRGGYSVIGDAVNVSSRLADLAQPGEILIGESTAGLLPPHGPVAATLFDTLPVKGKSEPLRVYRVVEREQAAPADYGELCPFVGRETSLHGLLETLTGLRSGRGGAVVIRGPAGVGKSRLVREALARLEGQPGAVAVHAGRGISYGSVAPWYPWSAVLRTLLPELEDDASGGAPVPPRDALAEVVSGVFEARELGEAERFRESVFVGTAAALRQAAERRPQIIVFEDAQWADATSCALLARLAPLCEEAPVALIALTRGDEAPLGPAALEIPLGPLAPAVAAALVDETSRRLGGVESPIQARVVERSGGIPLFVEELLRHVVANPGTTDPPTSLRGLVSARLDRAPPAVRERLEVASVFARDIDPALVDALLGRTDEAAWRALTDAGELQLVDRDGAPRLRFGNSLSQDIVYHTMLISRREELHLQLAELLERDAAGIRANLHRLGWHYERAGRPASAGRYWLRAADQAVSVHANVEALELYGRAIALTERPEVRDLGDLRFEARGRRARLLMEMGRGAEAVAEIEAMTEECARAGDETRVAELLSRRAYLAYQLGDGPGILEYARRALVIAGRLGEPEVLALALRQLGIAHEFAGRFEAAERAYLWLLDTNPEPSMLIRVYNSLGEIGRQSGRYEAAVKWYERSHQIYQTQHPGAVYYSYLNNLGATHVSLGQHERARRLLTEAIDERIRSGALAFLSESYYYRGLSWLLEGVEDQAVADAREALRLATLHQQTEMMGLSLRLGAQVVGAWPSRAREGLPESAESGLRASIATLKDAGKRHEEARSWWALGKFLGSAGGREGAAEALDTALQIFDTLELAVLAAAVRADREALGA